MTVKNSKATRTVEVFSNVQYRLMHEDLCSKGYTCYASEFVKGDGSVVANGNNYIINHYRTRPSTALYNGGDTYIDVVLNNGYYRYGGNYIV